MMNTDGNDQSQSAYVSVMDVYHVIFHVRTGHDASVFLSYIPGENMAWVYEIHLGDPDGGRSYVTDRMSGKVVAETITEGILSAQEDRPFWITWADNVRVLGIHT